MSQKPSIPKGTRDFSPQEMVRRNYIFDTIKAVFQRYGYLPIETPAMENLSTLMGKYGNEGDKLIFKILNSGDYMEFLDFEPLNDLRKIEYYTDKNTADKESIEKEKKRVAEYWRIKNELTSKISEKALRYDLTVPFARYVVQHQHEITFPFKRYQIQPVWRADRPQKGRYREFYQCDADVIGSNSLINEVELVQMIDDVFTQLGIDVIIKINNRKILAGIGELLEEKDKIIDITIALDKYDKVGNEIYSELKEKGFEDWKISKLKDMIESMKSVPAGRNRIEKLKEIFNGIEIGMKGIEEIDYIFSTLAKLYGGSDHIPKINFDIDLSLARGLNYYTGAIFEVKANAGTLSSSICGGGRYDDLTGIFGLPNMSGVGISFGADRIYDVLNELNLYPPSVAASTKLLFVTFGEKELEYCLPLLAAVRKAGINSEIYPDAGAKMKKQMSYADDKKIPFVVIVGSDEIQSGMLSLKDMTTGEQSKASIENIIDKLK